MAGTGGTSANAAPAPGADKGTAPLTGWQKLNWQGHEDWYYFETEATATSYNPVGSMRKGWLKDGKNADGTGSPAGGDRWFYLRPQREGEYPQGSIVTGWYKIGGSWYYFGQDGVMQTGWQKLEYQGKPRWFYLDENGAMQTGWQQIMYQGKPTWFHFGSSGAMTTGWHSETKDGKTVSYYLDKNGAMLTGTHTIDGEVYTFGSDGVMTS